MASSEINFIVAPYLKKNITKSELERISNAIESYYRKRGYFLPVVNAAIDGSTLKIKIIEGKIKNVFLIFEDEKRDKKVLKNNRLLDLINMIETASPLKTKDLERYLLLISKIHGYKLEYDIEALSKIQANNVADLIIEVATEKAVAEISVDNKGISDLGKYQVDASGQIFNPFGNDSLIFNISSSDRPKKFHVLTGGYLKRLNSYGTSASIFAAYSKDDPNYGSGSKDNTSTIIKGRVDHYLVLNNDTSFKAEFGIEHRDIENHIQRIKTRDYNYLMGSVGAKIKVTDPLNAENWIFPYYNWVLNKVSYNNNTEFGRNFDKDFNYFVVDWHREQALPKDFSLFMKASYQATEKLLPLEHVYSVGTSRSGRGYKIGIVSADQGISGTIEVRYNKEFDNHKFLERGQLYGFYDVTHFIRHNKTITRTQHTDAVYFNKSTLPALGFGIRLSFPYGIYGEGVAEYPTVRNIMIDGVKNRNRALYRFLLSKEFRW